MLKCLLLSEALLGHPPEPSGHIPALSFSPSDHISLTLYSYLSSLKYKLLTARPCVYQVPRMLSGVWWGHEKNMVGRVNACAVISKVDFLRSVSFQQLVQIVFLKKTSVWSEKL